MTTTEPRTEQEILDRESMDDVDAIAAFNPDPEEVLHAVQDQADALFTWDYSKGSRPRLDKLYEKAKVSQWNAQTDLDWSIEVDPLQAFSIFTESSNVGTGHWTEHPDSPAKTGVIRNGTNSVSNPLHGGYHNLNMANKAHCSVLQNCRDSPMD